MKSAVLSTDRIAMPLKILHFAWLPTSASVHITGFENHALAITDRANLIFQLKVPSFHIENFNTQNLIPSTSYMTRSVDTLQSFPSIIRSTID